MQRYEIAPHEYLNKCNRMAFFCYNAYSYTSSLCINVIKLVL